MKYPQIWITEIESGKSLAQLEISKTITVAELQTNFEVFDSQMVSGLRNILNGDFKRRIFIEDEAAQNENAFSRKGRSLG